MGWRLLSAMRCPQLACALLMPLLAAGPASAQPAPPESSVNDLVIDWLQGNYATPVVCTLGGEPRRGLRRILIAPMPATRRSREASVQFIDLDAADASRCFTEIGGDTPNITGGLVVRHPTTKRRPTAMRDFKTELKRKRGFELDIISGELELEPIGGEAQAESLQLAGGHLRVHVLRPGEDGLRVLQDLPSPRKVRLEFESPEGRNLSFPASLARPKGPNRKTRGR